LNPSLPRTNGSGLFNGDDAVVLTKGDAASHPGDRSRGSSDHDPQVARFRSRASLSVADVSVAEGDRGTTPMRFTVRASRALSEPVLICGRTLDSTASSGSDYLPFAGCQALAAGETSVTFTVSVRGDRRAEADETLSFVVGGAPGVRVPDPIAIGTIVNDD
jgi:uncharacterized protein